MQESNTNIMMYKGKPLAKCGNTIYYGDPNDSFIVVFYINETKKFEDREIPFKVTVELTKSDMSLRPRERILKRSEKEGFYTALDIGFIWLERALAMEKQQ